MNLNTITLSRWRDYFEDLGEFASRVKIKLSEYNEIEPQLVLENENIALEDFRAMIYTFVVIIEQKYSPSEYINRFSRMARFLSKRGTFQKVMKETEKSNFYTKISN
jgi:hypothetical protein